MRSSSAPRRHRPIRGGPPPVGRKGPSMTHGKLTVSQTPRRALLRNGFAVGRGRLRAFRPRSRAREPPRGRDRFTRTASQRPPGPLAGVLRGAPAVFVCVNFWRAPRVHAYRNRAPAAEKTPARRGGAPRSPVRVNGCPAGRRSRAQNPERRAARAAPTAAWTRRDTAVFVTVIMRESY